MRRLQLMTLEVDMQILDTYLICDADYIKIDGSLIKDIEL